MLPSRVICQAVLAFSLRVVNFCLPEGDGPADPSHARQCDLPRQVIPGRDGSSFDEDGGLRRSICARSLIRSSAIFKIYLAGQEQVAGVLCSGRIASYEEVEHCARGLALTFDRGGTNLGHDRTYRYGASQTPNSLFSVTYGNR